MPLLWLKILSTFRKQETLGGSMHSTKLIICVLLCLSLSDPLQRDWFDRRDRQDLRGLQAFTHLQRTFWVTTMYHVLGIYVLTLKELIYWERHKCHQKTTRHVFVYVSMVCAGISGILFKLGGVIENEDVGICSKSNGKALKGNPWRWHNGYRNESLSHCTLVLGGCACHPGWCQAALIWFHLRS